MNWMKVGGEMDGESRCCRSLRVGARMSPSPLRGHLAMALPSRKIDVDLIVFHSMLEKLI